MFMRVRNDSIASYATLSDVEKYRVRLVRTAGLRHNPRHKIIRHFLFANGLHSESLSVNLEASHRAGEESEI